MKSEGKEYFLGLSNIPLQDKAQAILKKIVAVPDSESGV